MYIKILEPGEYLSLKNIKFPVVVQAKPGPIFGAYVHINQFENLPGFDINLVYGGDQDEDYDLYDGESFYYFTIDECEIFKD
ncbi:hypothetical protein BI036_gp170 [Morganella phage vB_MmoM_MP1]|uniref:Uncharacterized protein n=1 Tax=Morganella phage vB_MmoM_MP1 TaxID=1852628 RepID=A0A192YA70_9CAUD|nr:hypothetical protein BI036_gp170 [Morganella phage vB_MmoM_MP1]ANM46614.1 hypothetical protein MP1_gp0224 [Morganella phage vB_MmoM_MP1]